MRLIINITAMRSKTFTSMFEEQGNIGIQTKILQGFLVIMVRCMNDFLIIIVL